MKTWPSVAVVAQTTPFLILHSEAARLEDGAIPCFSAAKMMPHK